MDRLFAALKHPVVFGMAFDRAVNAYQSGIGSLVAPIFHLATIIVFFIVLKYGNNWTPVPFLLGNVL